MLKFLGKIRIWVWFGLFLIFFWWGSKGVIRYWNQPLTTDLVYSFGDNEKGVQFPLISFCSPYFHVYENEILQECIRIANESVWLGFIEALAICLKMDTNFKINFFMDSFQVERKDICNVTRLWTGTNYINLQNVEDQIWSKVFHHSYGPCYTIDLSKVKEFEYIPYKEYKKPGIEFFFVEDIPWKEIRVLFHTKYDLPDALQLNGESILSISNETKQSFWIGIRKNIGKRESTRKTPCTTYEYTTCKNIEDNNLVLQNYNCQIPGIYYGQHLDNMIPKEILKCSNELAREAFFLISNKTSICTMSLSLQHVK